MKYFFILTIILAMTIESAAQTYQLKNYVIGASSQQVSNDDYKVNSTLGQPAIGKIQNIDNIAGIGFWYSLSQAPAPSTSQIIGLTQGWNIISSYISASDPYMQSVWASIVNDVVIVKNSDGLTYIPAYDINLIGNWNVVSGYQVYMSADKNLTINGVQIVPEATDIALVQGWSIISYLRTNPQNAVTSFETLTNDDALVIAKNHDGLTYIPIYGINQIGDLLPGQGYQVYLSKNSILTYPPNSTPKLTGLEYISPKPKLLIPEHKSTGSNMVILISGESENGNEIGVYNSNDILVGSGVFHNNLASVTVWGNDIYKSSITGALSNEHLKAKYLAKGSSQLVGIDLFDILDVTSNAEISNVVYVQNAFWMAKANIETSNNDFVSVNISPNPFAESVEISFNLTSTSSVKVSLFTIDGSLVKNLSDINAATGLQTINLAGAGLASGEYNLYVEIGNERFVKRLIKIK